MLGSTLKAGVDERVRNLRTGKQILASPADEPCIEFRSNGVFTLGVELELQIIDPRTLSLAARAEEILAILPANPKVKPELYLDMIELNTGICGDAKSAESDLSNTLDALVAAGRSAGLVFASTGSHPTSRYSDCDVYPAERYSELIDRNQWLTRRWKVYGLHVHLGMENGDECIRFNNFFLRLLPHLLALSSSAPFWQGRDTGLATCRPSIYEALPTAGLPYYARSWDEFVTLCGKLKKARAIKSLKDLWWDVRPSPGFGTLEIRVCDSPATLAEVATIVAFIHALAYWFRDHGEWLRQVPQPPHWMMRENKWRVIRHGLNADLVVGSEGENRPIRREILSWIEKTAPYFGALGYERYLKTLCTILERGTSSSRQRAIFARRHSLDDVVRFNMQEFVERSPIWDGQKPVERERGRASARPPVQSISA